MTDDEIYDFQRWLRGLGVMWTSELLRADGHMLRARFAADLMRRARNFEAGALRLCTLQHRIWTRAHVAWAEIKSWSAVACGMGGDWRRRVSVVERASVRSGGANE